MINQAANKMGILVNHLVYQGCASVYHNRSVKQYKVRNDLFFSDFIMFCGSD